MALRPADQLAAMRHQKLVAAHAAARKLFQTVFPQRQMPAVFFANHTPGKNPAITVNGWANIAAAYPAFAGRMYQPPGRSPLGGLGPVHPPKQRFNYAPGYPHGVVAFPYGEYSAASKAPGRWGADARAYFRDIMLHELAHTQQNPHLLYTKDRKWRMEHAADAFTKMSRYRVGEILGEPALPKYRPGYGPVGMDDFIREYGRNYVLHGQFQRG